MKILGNTEGTMLLVEMTPFELKKIIGIFPSDHLPKVGQDLPIAELHLKRIAVNKMMVNNTSYMAARLALQGMLDALTPVEELIKTTDKIEKV